MAVGRGCSRTCLPGSTPPKIELLTWSEPFTLSAGQSFTLRYRVLVHPGRADKETIEKEWRAFAARK
jgi:hypothetical protein